MNDDADIIARVLQGDAEGFRILVERYETMLFTFLRNLLGDRHRCEDLAQDVFLAAFQHLSRYDPAKASWGTWLLTIARNRCRNVMQRKTPLAMPDPPPPLDHDCPAEEAEQREFFRRLDAALETLPFEQKTAFVLAEIQGMSYEQIAQIEQTKLGTIKSRIARAKAKLRAALPQFAEEN